MLKVTLGKTDITVNKNGFGALPIQRISRDAAKEILLTAYQNGVTYFDTARAYSDSEEKIGYALSDVRDKIYIATKTMAQTGEDLLKDLKTSLSNLKTDYIDVYQFHNPAFVPEPNGSDGLYDAALQAQKDGKIRFIGITNHRLPIAKAAVQTNLFATMQFPFSYLASPDEFELVELCKENNIGFIAMKALSGGLISNSRAAYAFMSNHENALPIWGIQKLEELQEFLSYQNDIPTLDEEVKAIIENDKKTLIGGFCRGCGYCLPCPVGIDIPLAARMSLMLRRAPVEFFTTPEIQENMKKIEACIHCNNCKNHCPYGLDTPSLLKENYSDFKTFL